MRNFNFSRQNRGVIFLEGNNYKLGPYRMGIRRENKLRIIPFPSSVLKYISYIYVVA